MSARTVVESIQDIMRQDSGGDGDAQRTSQLCWIFFLKIIDDQDLQFEAIVEGCRSPIPAPRRRSAWAADPEGGTGDDLLNFVDGQLFPQLKALAPAGAPAAQASTSPTQKVPAVSAPHWKRPLATSGAESVLASSGPGVDCHAVYPADLTRYIASDVRIR